jgi:hypothetical protein
VICEYCHEEIRDGELSPVFPARLHRECLIRKIAGSAAHQRGECSCSGGDRADPPGMSVREAAVLAYDTFLLLRAGRDSNARA